MEAIQGQPVKREITNQLEKRILFQCLHDVQSPLSAISGYLELMQICMDSDKGLNKIEKYRDKIQSGVYEISQALEQIRYSFDDSIDKDGGLEVALYWLIEDICKNVSALAKKKGQVVGHNSEMEDYHLKNDIHLYRLLIYNILISLLKFTPKEGVINVSSSAVGKRISITFLTDGAERPASEVLAAFLPDSRQPLSEQAPDDKLSGTQAIPYALNFLNCSLKVEERNQGGIKLTLSSPEGVSK